MPRTEQQFEAMRNATGAKIISAAIELFSQKGVAGTTVQEIADTAGISVGLLYRHYKTKDDIFGALVQRALSDLRQTGGAFAGEPVETIKFWTRDVLHDISKDDEFVRFMHILSPTFVASEKFPGRDEILEANMLFREQIAALIAAGQAQGSFRDGDPLGMAQFFLMTVVGMCSMKLALRENFIAPSPAMVTAFLLKEEHND